MGEAKEMKLYPQPDWNWKADGAKYYIGNSQCAAITSTHSRYADTDEHVFFAADSNHHNYKKTSHIQTPGNRMSHVGEYELCDYPHSRAFLCSICQEKEKPGV